MISIICRALALQGIFSFLVVVADAVLFSLAIEGWHAYNLIFFTIEFVALFALLAAISVASVGVAAAVAKLTGRFRTRLLAQPWFFALLMGLVMILAMTLLLSAWRVVLGFWWVALIDVILTTAIAYRGRRRPSSLMGIELNNWVA